MTPRRATTKAEVERLKRESYSRWATGLAIVGAVTAIGTALGALSTTFHEVQVAAGSDNVSQEQLERVAADNARIRQQLAALQRQVAGLRTSTAPPSPNTSSLNDAVAEIGKRQQRLEDAISRDPARALEVPLLRRDVDNLKEVQTQAALSMSQRIDQILDLNKWLLGGGALSLLSIALSTLLSRWKARSGPTELS